MWYCAGLPRGFGDPLMQVRFRAVHAVADMLTSRCLRVRRTLSSSCACGGRHAKKYQIRSNRALARSRRRLGGARQSINDRTEIVRMKSIVLGYVVVMASGLWGDD